MTTNAHLADLGLAWQAPVHGAQQAFRALLAAMSCPGRVHALPAAAIAGVEPPASGDGRRMSIAATAALLTLLDAESSIHFAGCARDNAALAAYFRFHCGVPTLGLDRAAFVHARGMDADATLCEAMQQGSDPAPQDGATLVLDIDGFGGVDTASTEAQQPQQLRLRGPGIQAETLLTLNGSPPALWQWRAAHARAFPRGIDLLLCCGAELVAIPRSTLLTLESPCM